MRKDFNECQNQMWKISRQIEEDIYNHINGFEEVREDLEEEKELVELFAVAGE